MKIVDCLLVLWVFLPGLRAPSTSPLRTFSNRSRVFEVVDTASPEHDRMSPIPAALPSPPFDAENDPVATVMEIASKRWSGDVCAQAVKSNQKGAVSKANQKCALALQAFKKLAPEMQRNCPGARDARCRGLGKDGKIDSKCMVRRDAKIISFSFPWKESLHYCAKPLIKQLRRQKLKIQKSKSRGH